MRVRTISRQVARSGVAGGVDGGGAGGPDDAEPDGLLDLSPAVRAACGGDDDAFCTLYNAVQPGLLR